MDVSQNRGTTPRMDGENHGKPNPYFLMDYLGVFPYFWKHPIYIQLPWNLRKRRKLRMVRLGLKLIRRVWMDLDHKDSMEYHCQEYFMPFDFRVYCSYFIEKSCFVSCLLEIVGWKARYTGR